MRNVYLVIAMCLACIAQATAQVNVLYKTYSTKYYESMNAATPPADNWYAEDFDDSAWTDYTTSMTFPTYDAFWLRSNVIITDNPANYTFKLKVAHDDRGEFYVNGHQIHGSCGGCGRYNYYSVSSSYLRQGNNVIAAYTYDSGGGDQYLEFNFYAEGADVIVSYPKETMMTLSATEVSLFDYALASVNQKQLSALVLTPTGLSDATVTWASSDESVATVSNGLVQAQSAGTATITASATVGGVAYSKTCEVCVNAVRDDATVVYVETAGTLSTLITEAQKEEITSLYVVGTLNGDDMRLIRELAGRDVNDNVTTGALTYLNMSQASLVAGGDYYINKSGVGSYKLGSSNYLGSRMFYHCNNLVEVVLPETLTTIGYGAFQECSSLKSVTLNEGLKTIDSYAFYSCSNLQSISIPSTLTTLGYDTFRDCRKLATVTMPETSALSSIGSSAFCECDALTAIDIPSSVTSIDSYAFRYCDNLTTVNLPADSKLTTIREQVFYQCPKLSSICIPASVVGIESEAFRYCYALATVTIPADAALTSIGNNSFGNTAIQEISLPASLTAIGSSAFQYCSSLKTVTLPNDCKLTSIYSNAFAGCSSLEAFTMTEKVSTIGESAFNGCYSLTNFTIPATSKLASVGDYAFSGCKFSAFYIPQLLTSVEKTGYNNSRLKTITVSEKNTAYRAIDGILYSKNDDVLLAVPKGFSGQFRSPDFLQTIPANAFQGCTDLRSIILSANVTSVEANAFNGCGGLRVIHSLNTAPPTSLAESFTSLNKKTLPVFVPIGSLSAYQATAWNDFQMLAEYSTTPSMWISEQAVNLYDTRFDETRYKDLTAVVLTPQGPSDAAITWTSSNTDVATVAAGNVALVAPGTTDITASATVSGTAISAVCAVTATGFTADQNVYYVHAGGLSGLITEDEMYDMTNLTLFGELNSNDIGFIRRMCGCTADYYGDTTGKGKLANLDISNVKIVSGGSRYLYAWPDGNYKEFYTKNNLFEGYEFYGCNTLVDVKLPASVTSLGDCAFYDCNKLETVIMPENFTEIRRNTFYNCQKLNSISINWDNIETVGNYAFYGCSSLTSVSLPQATTLGEYAFSQCNSLKTITLPSVQSLGKEVFSEGSLEEIHLTSSTVPTLSGNNLFNKNKCVVIVPAALLSDYRSAEGWKNFYQHIVPDDANLNITATVKHEDNGSGTLTAIGEAPLSYVTHLTLKGSINSYDLMMFRNKMPNLHYLDLTETTVAANPYEYVSGCYTEVNRIGRKAFYDFKKLLEVKLPNSITYVGSSAFSGCSNLRAVTMYPGIVTIDYDAFNNCSTLTSVEIPEGVAGINGSAFANCYNLREVTLHDGLLKIGSSAFESCSRIKELVIPNTTTVIESYAFYNCSGLESISLPKNLTSVDYGAFCQCSSLKSVTLPSRVKSIGREAFYGCSNLEEFRIPPMVETIGNQAFGGCGKLKDIYVYIANAEDVNIDQNTFSCWITGTLRVPSFAYYSYYWNTQWSQFANIEEFDDQYDAFYTKNTMLLNQETGTVDGTPDATIYDNGGLEVDGVTQDLADVELTHDGTDGGSLIASGDGDIKAETLTIRIRVQGLRWHFFCFPFDIPLDNVTYDGEYVWRRYDGEARSRRAGGWQNLPEGTTQLDKGRGYIFQGTNTGDLVLTIANPDLKGDDVTTDLEANDSESAQDAGWNFVGNPYTSYYEVTEETYSAPITVWTGTRYEAYRPGDDDLNFAPYQAFFVQASDENGDVKFSEDNRSSCNESKENLAKARARRAQRKVNPSRLLINLELLSADGEECLDKTRVVFNNAQSAAYDAKSDASKFFSAETKAELYTLDAAGVQYAINERPVAAGEVPVGFNANCQGSYVIAQGRSDCHVLLVDNQRGTTHDLSLGGYEFSAAQGMNNGRFTLKLSDEATSVGELTEKTGISISTDDGIAISNVADDLEVAVFAMDGSRVASFVGSGNVSVPAGIYVISVGILSAKVIVK